MEAKAGKRAGLRALGCGKARSLRSACATRASRLCYSSSSTAFTLRTATTQFSAMFEALLERKAVSIAAHLNIFPP
jgi:hypothetical protein